MNNAKRRLQRLLYTLTFTLGIASIGITQHKWIEVHKPNLPDFDLFDLHFEDDFIVAVGYKADGANSIFETVILTSEDNGKTWEDTRVNGRFMKTIAFNNEGVGYMGGFGVGSTSFIMKSTDGGKSWNDDVIDASTTGITSIQFLDHNLGYATGYGSLQFATPNLYETLDGGKNWNLKINSSPEYTTFDKMTIIDGDAYALSSVYFSGSVTGNEMCYSADSGANWIQIVEHDDNIGGMAWLSGLVGFIVTDKGTIQKSIDGGVNWTTIHDNGGLPFFGISMNDSVGFAYGAEGLILRTSDKGGSWKKLETNTDKNISAVIIYDNRSYALGQDGIMLQLGGETPDEEPGGGGNPGQWPAGVSEVELDQFRPYPNPVVGQLINIDVEVKSTMTIYDEIGQVVMIKATDVGLNVLNCSSFSSGNYTYTFNNEHGEILGQGKIVVP